MAIFSFKHQFRPAFVIWTIVRDCAGIDSPRLLLLRTAAKSNARFVSSISRLDFVFIWKSGEHFSSFFNCESI